MRQYNTNTEENFIPDTKSNTMIFICIIRLKSNLITEIPVSFNLSVFIWYSIVLFDKDKIIKYFYIIEENKS